MAENHKTYADLQKLDFDIINGVSWAEDAWCQIQEGMKLSFLNFCKYVKNLTNDSQSIQHWLQIYLKEFEYSACELVQDIEDLNISVSMDLTNLLKKLQGLCKELDVEMPQIGQENRCLYDEHKQLRIHIEEYEKIKDIRQKEINELLLKQDQICSSLGKVPKFVRKPTLLTNSQMEDLRNYIDQMENEKFTREERFVEMKADLLTIMEELGATPSTEFERQVFGMDDSSFVVSDANMREINKLQERLHRKKKEVNEEIALKWSVIERLWTILEVNVAERSSFMEKHKGRLLETLEALSKEIKRLEAIKKENIKVFVEKYKTELLELWDKCHCDTSLRSFTMFNSDCYTEDLLELFELEINKWKRYYEENKGLLKLLEEYRNIWKRAVELEENTTDTNRFHNRGGKLLQEEKERNRLKKKIPQIEKEIYTLTSIYEERNQTPFLTWGKTITEEIENGYKERQNERQLRLSARKQQREHTTAITPAKSSVNLFPTTSTLNLLTPSGSTTKRKLLTTPRSEIKKKPRILETKKSQSEVKKRPIKVVSSRLSFENKKKRRRSSLNKKSSKANKENLNNTSSDYDQFQMELKNKSVKDNCRSTLCAPDIQEVVAPLSAVNIGTPRNVRQISSRQNTPKVPKIIVTHMSAAKSNRNLHF